MEIDIIVFDQNVYIYGQKAKSFPNWVAEAHDIIHTKTSHDQDRNYFGISRPDEKWNISYRAAADEIEIWELDDKWLEEIILLAWDYASIYITDFVNNMWAIKQAFDLLIKRPDIDPEWYCVELYEDKDVRCMIRLQ